MKDEKLYLIHILECIHLIQEYTIAGWESFQVDRKSQDAVIRNFEIIGEAVKRLSQETRDQAPQIPWRRIAGFRDVLIHQYEGVDVAEIWKNIEADLPVLLTAIEKLVGT